MFVILHNNISIHSQTINQKELKLLVLAVNRWYHSFPQKIKTEHVISLFLIHYCLYPTINLNAIAKQTRISSQHP